MNTRKLTRWIGYVGIGVVILLVLWAIINTVSAQTIDPSGKFNISLWAQHDRCYQHAIDTGGDVTASYGSFEGEGYMHFRWWGACNAKKPSSIVNAENGRVFQKKHGFVFRATRKGFSGGVGILRDAVHHFWETKDSIRTRGFPLSNDAEIAQNKCRRGEKCPSIGYNDTIRPTLGYEESGFDVEVYGPPYIWKDLTLPWPNWIIDSSYVGDGWSAGLHSEFGGLVETEVDAAIAKRLVNHLWIEARYGRLIVPGWREPINRAAFAVKIID